MESFYVQFPTILGGRCSTLVQMFSLRRSKENLLVIQSGNLSCKLAVNIKGFTSPLNISTKSIMFWMAEDEKKWRFLMKTFQYFLHIMDQTVQGPKDSFSAASKGHETPLFQLKSSSKSFWKMQLKWAWLAVRRREGVCVVWPSRHRPTHIDCH